MFDPSALAARLAMLRLNERLSCHALARRMHGCSYAYISKIELGKSEPSISILDQYAEYFGTTIHALLTDGAFARNEPCKDPFIVEIGLLVTKLSGYNRKIIIEVLQDLTAKVKPALHKSR